MVQLTILVADADEVLLGKLVLYLKRLGYSVESATESSRALESPGARKADLVVTGLADSVSFIRHVAQVLPRAAVLALAPPGERRRQSALFRAGADACLVKPFSLDNFGTILEQTYWRALCRADGKDTAIR